MEIEVKETSNELLNKFVSVPTLARRWECDEKLIYQEIAAKRLAGLRIGKKLLRVALSEVERYEEQYQTSRGEA